MARPSKILPKEDILRAMKMTRSNMAAARYLHVSYNHYKKYAKMYKDEDGEALLEVHKNQEGKGIPKFLSNKGNQPPLIDLLEGRVPIEHFDPQKVKNRIIQECLIEEQCNHCTFSERRVHDTKVPIILNHKDGNRKNWHLENLEFLCYNCAFLYATSAISDNEVVAMEHYVDKSKDEFEWEMDDHTINHLKDLGLYDDSKPGDEYISRQ
jgi:hypothetical protein|tara:strand:+ start:399 stop:1028 length:630 start_codon:yes stop_codon:yes gene_type:complete